MARKPDPPPKPKDSWQTAPTSNPATSMPDWVTADQATKESTPQNKSDGGKGVSN